MRPLLAGAVLLLAACPKPEGTKYAKPDGPIPVVLSNFYSLPLCYVSIRPSLDPAKMPPTEGMVIAHDSDKPPLLPGKSVRVNIQPGWWQIQAETCGFTAQSEKQSVEYEIRGPYAVGFDGEDKTSPPDYTRVTLRIDYAGHSTPQPDAANCLPKDAPLSAPADPTKCCSGRYYYNGSADEHPYCS